MKGSSENSEGAGIGPANRSGGRSGDGKLRRRRRARQAVMLGLALAVAFLVYLVLKPKSIAVDLATVEVGELRVTLDEEGETRVRDRYVVSAPIAGRVLRIELDPGDAVEAGETVLATFQPVDPTLLDARSEAQGKARVRAAESALGRAKAEGQRAEAEQKFARMDLDRHRRLRDEQVVATERLDQAELAAERATEALRAAKFAIDTAEHDLELARAGLLRMTGEGSADAIALTAPIDGVVLRRLWESESVVPAGEPLLEVADPAKLEIVSDFLSKDAVVIRPGAPVLIEQWGGDVPLRGSVRRVEPSGFTKISALGVEEQRVNVIVDVEDSRAVWEAMGDGYRVEVRVVVYENPEAVKVPTSALFRPPSDVEGSRWAVFEVEDGVAFLRQVQIGQRNSEAAEIVEGLQTGARVIVHPTDDVQDGAKVEARD